MPVTPDDIRTYDAFIWSIANDLRCFAPLSPESLLWHYTNGDGLLGIVQSGSLYSTQVSCLNDSEEIKYASQLFKSALSELHTELQRDGADTKLASAAVKYFEADYDTGALPYFVACFCEEGDAISQWRGYGSRGENGYSIGFAPAGLMQMGGLLARVNYDTSKHTALAKKVASATIDFYRSGLAARPTESPEKWAEEFMSVWDQKITELAPLVKDPCWAHEKEHRIVRLLIEGQLPELKVIQKRTMLTRHLPLKMATDCRYPLLPIKQVIVGPCPHPAISRTSVDTLLRQHGYPSGLVSLSSRRSYRDV